MPTKLGYGLKQRLVAKTLDHSPSGHATGIMEKADLPESGKNAWIHGVSTLSASKRGKTARRLHWFWGSWPAIQSIGYFQSRSPTSTAQTGTQEVFLRKQHRTMLPVAHQKSLLDHDEEGGRLSEFFQAPRIWSGKMGKRPACVIGPHEAPASHPVHRPVPRPGRVCELQRVQTAAPALGPVAGLS